MNTYSLIISGILVTSIISVANAEDSEIPAKGKYSEIRSKLLAQCDQAKQESGQRKDGCFDGNWSYVFELKGFKGKREKIASFSDWLSIKNSPCRSFWYLKNVSNTCEEFIKALDAEEAACADCVEYHRGFSGR